MYFLLKDGLLQGSRRRYQQLGIEYQRKECERMNSSQVMAKIDWPRGNN